MTPFRSAALPPPYSSRPTPPVLPPCSGWSRFLRRTDHTRHGPGSRLGRAQSCSAAGVLDSRRTFSAVRFLRRTRQRTVSPPYPTAKRRNGGGIGASWPHASLSRRHRGRTIRDSAAQVLPELRADPFPDSGSWPQMSLPGAIRSRWSLWHLCVVLIFATAIHSAGSRLSVPVWCWLHMWRCF